MIAIPSEGLTTHETQLRIIQNCLGCSRGEAVAEFRAYDNDFEEWKCAWVEIMREYVHESERTAHGMRGAARLSGGARGGGDARRRGGGGGRGGSEPADFAYDEDDDFADGGDGGGAFGCSCTLLALMPAWLGGDEEAAVGLGGGGGKPRAPQRVRYSQVYGPWSAWSGAEVSHESVFFVTISPRHDERVTNCHPVRVVWRRGRHARARPRGDAPRGARGRRRAADSRAARRAHDLGAPP